MVQTDSDNTTPLSPSASAGQTPDAPSGRTTWRRLAVPVACVSVAALFVALATLRWDEWVSGAAIQTTNDAYVRADLSQLSSRVSGEVLNVAVGDYQRVKAGDLLVQINPADYEAQVQQAEAAVAGAQAALQNLSNRSARGQRAGLYRWILVDL